MSPISVEPAIGIAQDARAKRAHILKPSGVSGESNLRFGHGGWPGDLINLPQAARGNKHASGRIPSLTSTEEQLMEYRSVLTSAPEALNGMLTGMVTPFNTWTPIGDVNSTGFYERVNPGAFANTLLKGDVAFLFNHDTGMPLARSNVANGAGSLSLYESPNMGLMMRAVPVQTSYGQDLIELTRTGVVNGMSFGFEVVRDAWTDGNGNSSTPQSGTHRTLLEVILYEVSAVTFPAYPTTTLAAS